MLGTLKAALDVRRVELQPDDLVAEVEGVNVVRDGLPVLTEVHVRYRLRIPAGTREAVDRALAKHAEKCPTAASLRGAVTVRWSAEVRESGEPGAA